MSDKKLVSVIVPIYNVEKYLLKCLNSIMNQTYKSIEVILVNDGATDNSGEIAKTFCKKDIRFFYFEKENGGLSSARNYGLTKAQGEYVCFIDSDDWIKDNYIESFVNSFDESIDIVIGKYVLQDEVVDKTYIPYRKSCVDSAFTGLEKEKEILERHLNAYPKEGYIIKDSIMPVWKNMYKLQMIKQNCLDFVCEKIVGAEDYVFNCKAYYYAKGVRVVEAAEYVHVIVNGSLSRKYYDDALKRALNKYQYVYNFLSTCELYSSKNVLSALDDELCRDILLTINNIIKQGDNETPKKVAEIMKVPEVRRVIGRKKVNLEFKYRFIHKIVKCTKVETAIRILALWNKPYKIYRMLQYQLRK